MKVQLSLNDELVARIDEYAGKHYLTRSGFVSLACSQYLSSLEMVAVLTDMSESLKKIIEMGEYPEEEVKKLQEYGRLIEMMAGKK